MEFSNLKAQYNALQPEIDANIAAALRHGQFILGPEVARLEAELAAYVGVQHCVTCGNGTDALVLALRAWEIGPGDAVFVPAFTFVATAEAVSLVGATPVFCDVDKLSRNVSPDSLETAILKVKAEGRLMPRAVIPVDLFGLSADYPRIRAIAQKYSLYVLEDGAQSMGGSADNIKCCAFGDIAATSFFPTKPLGCYGDGGAVFTNNDDWAELLRSLRFHGRGTHKYHNVRVGTNSRLDTLQAAVLLAKLPYLDKEIAHRNQMARLYNELLTGLPLELPAITENALCAWAQYTVVLPEGIERGAVIEALDQRGIPTAVYYPIPLHKQPVYESLKTPTLSTSELLCERVLSLPMSGYLEESEAIAVTKALREVLA